ncbi:MAG TPA: ATP-binding protein [Rhizomicrobium sp.]|jgi:signal transduction histidine kinase/CheY-like chemotaxis protein
MSAFHQRYGEGPESSVSRLRAELERANTPFVAKLESRNDVERRLEDERNRLHLLHQITRAIGEKQDIKSIFHVVSQELEDKLPVDFSCGYLFDNSSYVFARASIGRRSARRIDASAFGELEIVPLDGGSISLSAAGKLVHEADILDMTFPFLRRLAECGLRALVIAPLKVDDAIFGILVAARSVPQSFSEADREFLEHLSEHVALAARQAKLYRNLQQAYEDLRSTRDAAMQQERLRVLGQMSSGIAHDINNTISPLSLYTQSLLESGGGLSLRMRNYLETVSRVVGDVSATVSRMRDFYRERGARTPLSPLDLNEIIQQVVQLTRARWRDMPLQRGVVVHLHMKLAVDLPPVMGAAGEIREALTNLIFNAVDAMPDGGALTIRTAIITNPLAPVGDRAVSLDVVDTGIGMDEKTRQRCMEPFFTTKGDRGTGLGLATVYNVMERHGAKLEIGSVPGSGTCIRAVFIASEIPSALEQRSEVRDVPSLRILAIDDDPFVLDSLATVLSLDGHVLVSACGGSDGIEAFRQSARAGEPFDVVITDLGMPHVDGAQVAQAIKDASPTTPVILLTGWAPRTAGEAQGVPCADFVLGKPPDLDILRDTLAQCCRGEVWH